MVLRWDIITIGNLSRNRFWSERDDCSYRPAVCTCTLVTAQGARLLVDPSLELGARMAEELDRRTGLKVDDVDAVFITHEHGDHHVGLRHFPNARWYAAPSVADAINRTGQHVRKVEAAGADLFGDVEVIATPGHTMAHHSLSFECDGLKVVVAGDAVMTRDFWVAREGFHNSADVAAARASMAALKADAIVPGHDNYFLTAHLPSTGDAR